MVAFGDLWLGPHAFALAHDHRVIALRDVRALWRHAAFALAVDLWRLALGDVRALCFLPGFTQPLREGTSPGGQPLGSAAWRSCERRMASLRSMVPTPMPTPTTAATTPAATATPLRHGGLRRPGLGQTLRGSRRGAAPTAAPTEIIRFQEEKEDFMAHSYGLGTRAPYHGPTNTGGQFRDNPTGRQIRMAPEATA